MYVDCPAWAKLPRTTYTLLVVFTVDACHNDDLPDERAIRDEATSWLQSLHATVDDVCVGTVR